MDDVGSPAKKRKRTQLSACDACRIRRVRCHRDSVEEACQGCAQRGLTCTSDYVINKASNGAGRPGRLMEQVKLLYGSGETSSGSDSTTPELPLIAVPTSPQSPENVLAATQQAEFVASALIDTFKRYLFKWQPTSVAFPGFFKRFEAAGRRPSQLRASDQILCDLVMAHASRWSSLPLIVGNSAPSVDELTIQLDSTLNLSQFGRRREAFCQGLESRAKRHADRKTLRHHASPESITALFMFELLETEYMSEQSVPGPKIYTAAAVEHLRALALKTRKTEEEELVLNPEAGFLRGIIAVDALVLDISRQMMFSDDDLALFLPAILEVVPSDIRTFVPDPNNPLSLCHTLANHVVYVARFAQKRCFGPMARRRPATAAAFDEVREMCIMELDACERIDAGLVEPWRVLAQAIAADMFAFSAILIGLRAVIGERIAETEDELQRVELEGSMRRFDTVFDRARRCLARCTRDKFAAGKSISDDLFFTGALLVAEPLFSIPHAEIGGPPFWPLAAKVDDIEWIIKVTRSMAWSDIRMLAKAAKYEARLDALRTPSLEISLVETLPPMPTVEVEMTTDFDWLLDVTAPPSAPAMTEQSVDDLIRDLLGDAAASSQPSQATLVACESDVT